MTKLLFYILKNEENKQKHILASLLCNVSLNLLAWQLLLITMGSSGAEDFVRLKVTVFHD